MPEEMIDGIYQLKVPIPNNPLGWVLPYLIPGDDGYTLVDCGWNTPEAFEALETELRDLNLTFRRHQAAARDPCPPGSLRAGRPH